MPISQHSRTVSTVTQLPIGDVRNLAFVTYFGELIGAVWQDRISDHWFWYATGEPYEARTHIEATRDTAIAQVLAGYED